MRLTSRPVLGTLGVIVVALGLLSGLPAAYGAAPHVSRATDGVQSDPSQVALGLIVKTDPELATARAGVGLLSTSSIAGLTGNRVTAIDRETDSGIAVYRFAEPMPASALALAVGTLNLATAVEWAEPDLLMQHHAQPSLPNDPEFGDQWHLWKDGTSRDFSVEAPVGWQYTSGRSDVVVAVLDTGWTQHPDLDNRQINGYDFVSDPKVANDGDGRDNDASDPGDWISASDQYGYFEDCPRSDSSWHGTHVAGIIAAERGNNRGVAGVAPDVRVMGVRVLGKCFGTTSDIAAAIRWSAGESVSGVPDNRTPAKVINLSLGSTGPCGNAFREAIRSARSRGTVVVAAAGNEGSPISSASPANCPGVISVVATNPSGTRTSWSNYGTGSLAAGIAAPGESILATINTGRQGPSSPGYGRMSGTSMAAPVAAAAVALLMSAGITAEGVPAALAQLTKSFPSRGSGDVCNTTSCGPGLINLSQLKLFVTGPGPGPDPDPDPGPGPGPDPGPTPLTAPGIIADVRVKYAFKGAFANAAINWAHTEGAQRSIYYMIRVKRGDQRWTGWSQRVAPSFTVTRLPRADLSFFEIRGVNEMGPGLIYQISLYPKSR
jgi:serine protease